MTVTRAVMVFLVLASVALVGQKAGWWGQPEVRAPYPPTPAALAWAEQQRREAERAETARAEAARMAAVQRPAETADALPAGHGREDTFAACTACHSTAIIRRSGLSRERWDALMDWMVEKQGMNPLDPDQRVVIVDYLAGAFPPRRTNPRGANPFLPN